MCGWLATVNSLCSATFSFSLSLSLAVFTHWQWDFNQSSSACRNVWNRLFTDACARKPTLAHQQQRALSTHCHTHRNYTHHTVTKDWRPACESLCACPLCAQSDSDGVSAGCDLLSAGWPERQTEWHLWSHHCRNNRRKGIRGQISLLSPRDCSGKKETLFVCKSECPLLGTPE